MIRELRMELDRVDRCLVALESLSGPRRGRPRKLPLALGRRINSRSLKLGALPATPKAQRSAAGD